MSIDVVASLSVENGQITSWHRIELLRILAGKRLLRRIASIEPPPQAFIAALRLRRNGRPCARGNLAAGLDGLSAGTTRL